MLSHQRIWRSPRASHRMSVGGAFLLSCTALAGCSADLGRFIDSPSVGLSDTAPIPSEPVRRNAGGPVEQGNWDSSGPRNGDALPPPAPRQALMPPPASQGVRIASLPSQTVAQPVGGAPAAARPAPTPLVTSAPKTPIATNGTVDVQPGDTLYGLSKRYGVSIAAIMDANQLTGPNLKPGQKLAMPVAGSQPKKPLTRPAPVVAAVPAAATTPVAAPSAVAAAPANWDGSYTLKAGDSLYAVARAHKVQLAELQRVNAITEPLKIRPGLTLKVPSGGSRGASIAAPPVSPVVTPPASPAPATASALPPRVVATPAVPPAVTGASAAGTAPKIINASPAETKAAEQKVAALGGTASDAPASGGAPVDPAPVLAEAAKPVRTAAVGGAAATGPKFRWPAKGKVIGEFGKRTDGTHNDGVNIAVPAGTDIHAAEGGTVAYAGSELKGYGNLVLIRHDNGWVSAYAHSDQILVKRGDAIKRGQVIAKAGKTGTVDQPQVHFELRQGSKPVDPLPHMEKN